MYPIVHCSTIYNSQNMEATWMCMDRCMVKEAVVHMHNGILLSIKRNAFESVLMKQMKLEPIIQSEVSQKEKDKFHILIYIYGIQKNGTEEFIYRAAMEKQTQRIDMDMGRGEERVRCMERVTCKLTLPYVKQIANGNLLYGSGNSKRGSISTQRGGMGGEMGGRFKRERIHGYLWLIHAEV